jgi:hypothetical protein
LYTSPPPGEAPPAKLEPGASFTLWILTPENAVFGESKVHVIEIGFDSFAAIELLLCRLGVKASSSRGEETHCCHVPEHLSVPSSAVNVSICQTNVWPSFSTSHLPPPGDRFACTPLAPFGNGTVMAKFVKGDEDREEMEIEKDPPTTPEVTEVEMCRGRRVRGTG